MTEVLKMRDYKLETEKRVAFIKEKMAEAHAQGLVFGNSGGKDRLLWEFFAKWRPITCSQ